MDTDAMFAVAPQHLRALERANLVRLARAALKRRVASGELTVLEVVASNPWEAESMPLSDLLMSQRRWGRTRCRKLLASLALPENKPLGSLTSRQRTALIARLRAAGCGSWDDAGVADERALDIAASRRHGRTPVGVA